MLKYLILCIGYFFFQEGSIPYKPSEDFKLNVDLKFKTKPSDYGANTYAANGNQLKKEAGLLPFLSVSLSSINVQADEVRLIAVDSNGKSLVKKKLPLTRGLQFEFGFVDELKRNLVPNELTIYFLAKDNTRLRKIVVTVQEDGTFLVNGSWRGKF